MIFLKIPLASSWFSMVEFFRTLGSFTWTVIKRLTIKKSQPRSILVHVEVMEQVFRPTKLTMTTPFARKKQKNPARLTLWVNKLEVAKGYTSSFCEVQVWEVWDTSRVSISHDKVQRAVSRDQKLAPFMLCWPIRDEYSNFVLKCWNVFFL